MLRNNQYNDLTRIAGVKLTSRILEMIFACRVNMDAVHVNQAGGCATAQAVQVKAHAFLQHVRIPSAVARLSAGNELDRRVE